MPKSSIKQMQNRMFGSAKHIINREAIVFYVFINKLFFVFWVKDILNNTSNFLPIGAWCWFSFSWTITFRA
jgi:hypothetical protein